jgi:hypothetical protein
LSAEYARRASESLLKRHRVQVCAKGRDLISFTRSSGGIVVLSLERKHLEKFLSFEELKHSKVKHRKLKFEGRTSMED